MPLIIPLTTFVVLIIIGVDLGLAVKCFSCSSETNENCLRPDTSGVPLVTCDLKAVGDTQIFAEKIDEKYRRIFQVDGYDLARHLDLNCLKLVAKDGNKRIIIRGCQLAEQEKLDICKKVRDVDNKILTTDHCSRCSSDGCNSSTTIYSVSALLISALMGLLSF